MSAGGSVGSPHDVVVDNDTMKLAPKMQAAVAATLLDCHAEGLDAVVFEAMRSAELQEAYWHRGRPPTEEYPLPVTNARSNLYSWHGFGLAVDIISDSSHWFVPMTRAQWEKLNNSNAEYLSYCIERAKEGEWWFSRVAALAGRHGLKWGGNWKRRDLPHFQWHLCKPTPSDLARRLFQRGGLNAVWAEVDAK